MEKVVRSERSETLLLQEVVHRTKNNLAMLSAMIRLQARTLGPKASNAIQKYEGKFDPSQFKDRYGDALIERKQKEGGIKVRAAATRSGAATNVVNLMNMLKASVGKGEAAKPSRRAAQPRAAASTKRPAPAKRSSARGRKAG